MIDDHILAINQCLFSPSMNDILQVHIYDSSVILQCLQKPRQYQEKNKIRNQWKVKVSLHSFVFVIELISKYALVGRKISDLSSYWNETKPVGPIMLQWKLKSIAMSHNPSNYLLEAFKRQTSFLINWHASKN